MADRFPLILNTSTNQIQEIASGDQLDLTGNNIANAGIITATTFSGNLTGNVTGNINGNLTGTLQTAAQPNITSLGTLSSLNVTGNATIGGVLTYEDVTSVDSIGIITARAGFHCSTDGVGNGIKVGAGSDLIIQHNGTNSFIDNNTGDLYIQTTGSGDDILVESADDVTIKVSGSETAIQATGDGAVELYYDGSKKFETTSLGAQVTGRLNVSGNFEQDDNVKANWGNSHDLQIWHDGSHSYIKNSTNYLYHLATQHHFKNAANNELQARFQENGAVEFYFDNSKKLETQTNGTRIYDSLGIGVNATSGAAIYVRTPDGTSGSPSTKDGVIIREGAFSDGKLIDFQNSIGNTDISVDGSLNLNFSDNHKIQLGDSQDLQIYHDGSDSLILDQGTGRLNIRTNGDSIKLQNTDGGQEAMGIFNSNGSVDLYFNGSKKFETTSTGAKLSSSAATLRLHSTTDQQSATLEMTSSSGETQVGKISYNHANSGIVNGYNEAFLIDGTETNIAVKVDGAIKIPDVNPKDSKLLIGTGDDLQIYHDGTVNRIRSDVLTIIEKNDSEDIATFNPDGGVALFYDGSKKFETTSTGVSLLGGDHNATGTIEVNDGSNGDCFRALNGGATKWCLGTTANTGNATVSFDARSYSTNKARLHKWTSPNRDGGSYGQYSEAWYDGGTYRILTALTSGFAFDHHVLPGGDNTYDLGNSSLRWRNIYTNDLNLSNEGSSNDVDNTWGDYTIQEGESDLFLINNRNGKKYKFNLTEVS